MKSNNDTEDILDKVISGIRNEQIDPLVINGAADRVWARISAASSGALSNESNGASLSHTPFPDAITDLLVQRVTRLF